MRLLLIEDSERLRRSLSKGLGSEGHLVEAAEDGVEGLAAALGGDYEVIVLDLMLPRMSGLEVLRRLRDRGIDSHVLILSARDQVEDRVRGLHLGADDYLIKPFSFDELCARLEALVRRRYGEKCPKIDLGSVVVNVVSKRVEKGGAPIDLTPSEYRILELLAQRRGQVFSKERLIDHLYSIDAHVTTNTIEVLISSLRRKVDDPGADSVIRTRRGFGYTIEAAS